MERSEHLAWAKSRALEYLQAGDVKDALGSMISDMTKHPELYDHPGLTLGGMMLASGHLQTAAQVRDWVEGFN